jgi:hypothetical protein
MNETLKSLAPLATSAALFRSVTASIDLVAKAICDWKSITIDVRSAGESNVLPGVGLFAVGMVLKEEFRRHLQYLRNLLQAARTDAVGSFLVFLNLLESEPEAGKALHLLVRCGRQALRTRYKMKSRVCSPSPQSLCSRSRIL